MGLPETSGAIRLALRTTGLQMRLRHLPASAESGDVYTASAYYEDRPVANGAGRSARTAVLDLLGRLGLDEERRCETEFPR